MKKLFYTSTTFIMMLCSLTFTTQTVLSQDARKAVEYMSAISTEYQAISKDLWSYTSAVAHGKSARKVEKRRAELIGTTQAALKKAKKMPGFNGDASYRDSVVSYFMLSYLVLSEDYEKIVNMEEIAEQSYDKMEAYMLAQQIANDKLNAAGDMVSNEEKKFAAAHNVNLIESKDELSRNLKKAGEVFHHYNQVYLLFFKPYKEDVYFLDAMNKSDVNAMEQNRNSLIRFANESLKSLDTMQTYKSDNSLKIACKRMLEFYKTEAETKFPVLSGFYLKKENFEKIKKAMDLKSQSERTQEDVDAYNNAVKDFNNAVNEFNKTNQDMNTQRGKALDTWNQLSKSFLDRNVPKQ